MSTLRIETKGEHVRNLLALRLKEYDRNIERIDQARLVAVADLERADKNVEDTVAVARARAAAGPMNRNQFESVGLSTVYDAKQQVERLSNAIDTLKNQRGQVEWLRETFRPDQAYQLDGQDLQILGIGAGAYGARMGAVLDPLDL